MPSRRYVRGRPAWRDGDPQDQEVPNAPEVKPSQGEMTNVEFRDAFRMLIQVVTN